MHDRSEPSSRPASLGFLEGGGEATRLIRERDWTGHPLGPPESWPPDLRAALSLILNSPESMILAWGPDLSFFFNETYFPLLGPRLSWAMGERFDKVWADGWAQAKPIIDAAFEGREQRFVDLPWKLGTDRGVRDTFWTFSYSRVLDGEGRVAGLFIFTNETTARVEGEAALRASEAIARENIQRVQLALSAGAIIGTWLWDLPTDRFTVDEAFARSFGLDPALGREGLSLAQVVQTVHPDDQDGLAAAIGEAVAHGGAYAHQYRTLRADGQYRWLEANGRVDRAPTDGTPLSFPGVLIDVEDRREAEEERQRATQMLRELNDTLEQRVQEKTAELMLAEEALRQSQKMEAVGQLTGGLAHDFNNLLAGISGSLDLIEARLAQGRAGEVGRYIAAAQGAARRAAALTHRLLAFSRRQTLDPKPTDVNRLVAEMEDLVRRTVGPAIAVETAASPDLWPTLVDPNQLENALLNLCINARDAMPGGGRITIETANRRLDEGEARERELQPGAYVTMSVSDTGTGMTPDVLEKAFDPFFTTKPIGVGTGLGLSMIYGFARQSGGQARIRSRVGEGTTVRLFLPRHDEAEAAPPEPEAAPAPARSEARTVLVVDDEPIVRMLIVDAVEDLGFTALEAADGPGAMRILRTDAAIDLLVTDVGLPNGMNGRQMADAARELRPGLRTIFVTGYAENAVLGAGDLDAGTAVVTKPFDLKRLAERIRVMAEG